MPKYTLDAGRCIVRDGAPWASLHGIRPYDPCELDSLARDVVALLNAAARREERKAKREARETRKALQARLDALRA